MASTQCHKPRGQATCHGQGGSNNQQSFGQKVKEMASGMFKGTKEHKNGQQNPNHSTAMNCFGHHKAENRKPKDRNKINRGNRGHGGDSSSSSDSENEGKARYGKKM